MKMSEGPPRHTSPSLPFTPPSLSLSVSLSLSPSLLRLVDFVVCLGVQAARANGRLINSIIALGVCKKKLWMAICVVRSSWTGRMNVVVVVG